MEPGDGPTRLRSHLCEHRAAVTVLLTGTIAGLGVGIATDASAWPVYAGVVVLGAVVVAAVHMRVGFSSPTIWGLVAFALGHLAGGMVPVGSGVLYEQWLVGRVVRYDNVQHAVGFGFVGRAVWETLRRAVAGAHEPRRIAGVLVLLAGVAAGALNEIVEYALTLILPETNVGGYDNTARDLIANLVGSAAAAFVTARSISRAAAAQTPR